MELSLLLMRSILSMALMVLMGWGAMKLGLFHAGDSAVLAVLNLYIVCPCMLISAFQVEYTPDKLYGLLLAFGMAVLFHLVLILLLHLAGRLFSLDGVDRGSLLYSNCGNLIIPLITSLLGKEYVLYTSAFLVVQILLSWTHLVRLLSATEPLSPGRVLRNPNVLAIAVGMGLFFGRLQLPAVLDTAVEGVGVCVGPLGMFAIGILVAQADWSEIFRSRRSWAVVFGRLILAPLLFILLVRLTGAASWAPGARQVLLVTFLAASAPVAVTVSQMADLYHADSRKAGAINVLSVLLSVATMPLMTMAYQLLC